MKVRLGTIEVSDEERRALRRSRGETGLATREEIRNYFFLLWDTDIPDHVYAMQREDALRLEKQKAEEEYAELVEGDLE